MSDVITSMTIKPNSSAAQRSSGKKTQSGKSNGGKVRNGNPLLYDFPWLRSGEIPSWLQPSIADRLPCVHTWNTRDWLRKVDELNAAQTKEEREAIIAEAHKEAQAEVTKAAARRQQKKVKLKK